MSKIIIRAFEYSDEEQDRCCKFADDVIDLLKPLTIKEKWLVIDSLYKSFPKEDIK